MYGMEFKARALRVLARNNGSCSRTARELGVVNVRTLYRWRSEQEGFVRRRYVRLMPAQKRCVARRVKDGADVRAVAAEYGVCVATVYNIRNESRAKGALAFMGMGHDVEVPDRDPAALPDDVERLRKRCEDLELDNAILAQTVEILKKRPRRRPVGDEQPGENDGDRRLEEQILGFLAVRKAEYFS